MGVGGVSRADAAGAGLKNLGNTIAGALGGLGGGQILTALLPMLAGTGLAMSISARLSDKR